MKKLSRISAFILLISVLFTLGSCGINKVDDPDGNGTNDVAGEGDVVMSYEGFNLTESEFKCIAAFIKDKQINQDKYALYQQYGKVFEESQILEIKITEDKTYADLLMEETIKYARIMLVVEKLCHDAEITISDQELIDSIDEYIEDVKFEYGGEDLFEIELVKLGFSETGIRRYYNLTTLYNLLFEDRYGENGTAALSKDVVEEYFLENFYCFDGVQYSFVDSTKGSYVSFDFTDEEINDYFYDNYAKVKSILYKSQDSYGNALSSDVKSARKAKAEDALAVIQSGEKTFDDFKTDSDAYVSEYVFTKGEIEYLEKAVFEELKVGERKMVESEYGYFVIEKVALTDTDLKGTVDENGKTTGDKREAVKKEMSFAKVRDDASITYNNLKEGVLKDYPAVDKNIPYYMPFEKSFIDKNNPSTNVEAEVLKLLSECKDNEYFLKEFSNSGVYICRKIAFDKDDITSDIYTSIEELLATTEFMEYLDNYYDAVEIDAEYFESFDIVSLPLLEDEFYNSNGG